MPGTNDRDKVDTKAVARAIRTSRLLDPALKKRWLDLLPHMGHDERYELWSILTDGEKQLDQLEAEDDGQDRA